MNARASATGTKAYVASGNDLSKLITGRVVEQMIQIRQATEADAVGAIATLRCSITELCVPDHGSNPALVGEWLSNKTVDSWRNWIEREDGEVIVAEQDGKIVGVGMTTLSGEILLNYVHPGARFKGVSKAILASLEEALKSRGVQCCRLESTITAQRFYESRGFRSKGHDALTLTKPL